MRTHTDSIDTVYSRGLLARVNARSAKKASASTKARNRWKRVTTWLSKVRRSRSRDTSVQPSLSATVSEAEHKKTTIPTQEKVIQEPCDMPTSRLIRRELKHLDSSELPGITNVYSKSEPHSPREKQTLYVGEQYHIKRSPTPTQIHRWNSHSPTSTTSKELNTRATISESFDILPPMFDPKFHVYMNTRLEAIRQLREEDKKRESICECLIS